MMFIRKLLSARMLIQTIIAVGVLSLMIPDFMGMVSNASAATATDYKSIPPFVSAGVPPLVMLVMSKDHKLYYEAYNDASDLNEDDIIDVGYNPAIEYYGYFDSYKYYEYDKNDSSVTDPDYTSTSMFVPVGTTTDKKAPAGDYWSGDFLNYLTMTRMDCLRKVLYGGYRYVDEVDETVLERAFVPQEGHTWGKEYTSVADDGYDIQDYTPLDLPEDGTRHLFANVSLNKAGGYSISAVSPPLLRVLNDSKYRIWEWVAKEQPVAGIKCANGNCEATSSTIETAGHPASASAFQTMVDKWATTAQLCGTGSISQVNTTGSNNNPFSTASGCSNDYYLTIIEGQINASVAGDYQFATNGDDAVEFLIDGSVVTGWYSGHGASTSTPLSTRASNTTSVVTITLTAGWHDFEFRHEEGSGSDSYQLLWMPPGGSWAVVPATSFRLSEAEPTELPTITTYSITRTLPASIITDYIVRVKVGLSTMPETSCKQYGGDSGYYKPAGLLQKHGETDSMYFGLLTGSYTKNMDGGVLRKNIGTITDEIDLDTGQFKTTINGIIKTINTFRIVDYNYSADYGGGTYAGLEVQKPMPESSKKYPDWGNPIGEMMYETLRYFAVDGAPNPDFTYSVTTKDATLGLPVATWTDPFIQDGTTNYCAQPFMLVISDIYPSYDSEKLPGSAFSGQSSVSLGDGTLDVEALLDDMSSAIVGSYYIGQSGTVYDSSCFPKDVDGVGYVRGLCPEEPTKQGSYYPSSVAYYGHNTDLRTDLSGDQKVSTYTVALSSPLPEIKIPVGDQEVSLVPFGKSVSYSGNINYSAGAFQPTLTIVDFFIEELAADKQSGKFRINFEDVEQGNDHDMDVIVIYEYWVEDGKVKVKLTKEYEGAGITMHMGYIISGTTKDGIYLDLSSQPSGDVLYYLDTPTDRDEPGRGGSTLLLSNGVSGDSTVYSRERTFTPGSNAPASLLKNPLWYAAKWGGFEDSNDNDKPDLDKEWDGDGDEDPDTYFYVVNPLKLEEQLGKAFVDILKKTSSGTAASVISQSRSGEGAVYQAVFYPEREYDDGAITWAGSVHALFVDSYGNMREDTNDNQRLDVSADDTGDLVIVFDETEVKKYKVGNELLDTSTATLKSSGGSIDDINFLWTSDDWLNTMSDADAVEQRSYTDATKQRRCIFTFVDTDQDMISDTNEIQNFVVPASFTTSDFTDTKKIFPYINLFPTFGDEPTVTYDSTAVSLDTFRASTSDFDQFLTDQYKRVINYIRGEDQGEYTSTTTPEYTLPAFRLRKVDSNNTWRLGDIVYSTPTVVGRPSENYHLLYKDDSYAEFLAKYQGRRQVVYAGANDGMFHAFNGGFFKDSDDSFGTTGTNGEAEYELGSELWAYIPYNLLPHLYWLTEDVADPYSHHVYYCDLQPKIFDAKILGKDISSGGHYSSSDGGLTWGTFLVAGMRLGGGEIVADMDKTDGNVKNKKSEDTNGNGVLDTGEDADGDGKLDVYDRTMKSAYFIFDITDPEEAPVLIAELSLDNMGYTTSNPTVVPMMADNTWYLVFGSGPADSDGYPATATGGSGALTDAISEQSGKIFVVDLKALVQNKVVKVLYNDAGEFNEIAASDNGVHDGAHYYQEFEDNSFIGDPVTVDYDMDFNADAVYFGTIEGDGSTTTPAWNGRLRRIVIANNPVTSTWDGDKTLIETPGQPISADANITIDDRGKMWVYFGTGRYFVDDDEDIADQQSYYGIIEPFDDIMHGTDNPNGYMDSDEYFNWATVVKPLSSTDTSLVDVSKAVVKDDKSVSGVEHGGPNTIHTWDDLMKIMDDEYTTAGGGWYMDFRKPADLTANAERERNVSQAALYGELVTFTTYTPSGDLCDFGGTSNLYALYYKTGTAYYEDAIGSSYHDENGNGDVDEGETEMVKMVSMGSGLAGTPNIHTGKDSGTKAFIQTSTGDIITIKQINPGVTKSGVLTWKETSTECN